MRSITLTSPPASEPVSLVQVKNYLRVDFPDDDELILALIMAARDTCESYCEQVFVSQQWQQTADTFPYNPMYPSPTQVSGSMVDPTIYLLRGPVLSVDLVQYVDTTQTLQVLPPNWYVFDPNSKPPRIYPQYGYYWPPTLPILDAVTVNFTCGFATVPQAIQIAIMQMVSYLYERPETGAPMQDIPMVVKALLVPYKVWG